MQTNLHYWFKTINEQDSPLSKMPVAGDLPDPSPSPEQQQEPMPDISQDPQIPDRPEEQEEIDFPNWRKEFFDLSIKGDVPQMLDSVSQIREMPLLGAERKFVEDNLQILFLRQDSSIDSASKEVRKLIKQELDRANPATTVMQHIMNTLDAYPQLMPTFVKLCGFYALKGDLHRKFMAALTGSVQVGGGGEKEDLILSEKEYSINFSTRFYTDYGNIAIGEWSVQEDDPQKYLSIPEVERLESGSPEERQVLRNRVVLESIAERFQNRAFLIHVIEPNTGTIHAIGCDLAECLREGYQQGKFVVRPQKGVEKRAMFSMDGRLLPFNELGIFFVNQTAGDIEGIVSKQEVPFMQQIDGKLHLKADADTLEQVSNAVSGFFTKDIPYQGNPSDLVSIMRCVPSMPEFLLRKC